MVTELLQCSDAGEMCVSLCVALKAGSEDSVAEEMLVQLQLHRGWVTEQRPVETGWKVAIDDLLRPPQDEHTGQARQLSRSLFSQNALLLLAKTDMRSSLMSNKDVLEVTEGQREHYLCAGWLSRAEDRFLINFLVSS